MLKAVHILCLLFLTCTLSHAQNATTSIQNLSTNELVIRIKTVSPKEVNLYITTFLKSQDKDENWTKNALDVAYHFYKKENYEQSMQFANVAIENSKRLKDDSLLLKCYLRKGNIYNQLGENENALESYYALFDLSSKIENVNYQFLASMNIAVIHRIMQQYDKALEKCTEALNSIEKTNYKGKKNHVNLLTIISETYLNMEQFEAALTYIKTGLAISETLNYEHGKVDLLIKKGIIFYKKEAYNLALEYLHKADEILKNNSLPNSFYQKTYTNYFLAACFFQQENYQKTVSQLLKTIDLLKKDPKRDAYIIDTYLLLAKSYNKLKNTDQTLYWHEEYLKLNTLLEKDKSSIRTKIYEKETQYFKDEIALLKQEKQQSNTISWYAIICAIFFIILGIIAVLRMIRKQKSSRAIVDDLTSTIHTLDAENKNLVTRKKAQKLFDIEATKVTSILKKIEKLEATEYFLKLECSLSAMAKKLKTNRSYLSQIIKTHKKKSFNDYINDLRIEYTIHRLNTDKKFCLFSITSIAKEVGYKSDYSLVKHFKERTGQKPSIYIKNILEVKS
ncbi:helix-turn-helix domain-containing protein [Kordia sp.]|uniref:helix-turn-helix domain-containing protein n=1 Tax=Kordia sp. TaxID=1965332 RepID=UPI003D2D7C79